MSQQIPSSEADFEDPLADFEPRQYNGQLSWALAEQTVSDIKPKQTAKIGPSTTVREAVEAMARLKTASLLVMDGNELVGLFTERDVLERVSEAYDRHAEDPVSKHMTEDPVVLYESDPAAAAVAAIAVAGYRHVPVLSMDQRLVAMLGPRCVFDFVAKHFES